MKYSFLVHIYLHMDTSKLNLCVIENKRSFREQLHKSSVCRKTTVSSRNDDMNF